MCDQSSILSGELTASFLYCCFDVQLHKTVICAPYVLVLRLIHKHCASTNPSMENKESCFRYLGCVQQVHLTWLLTSQSFPHFPPLLLLQIQTEAVCCKSAVWFYAGTVSEFQESSRTIAHWRPHISGLHHHCLTRSQKTASPGLRRVLWLMHFKHNI